MSFLTKTALRIKTDDVISFLNRWIAVGSILIVFITLTFAFWKLLIDEQSVTPAISLPSKILFPANKSALADFYYFDGIGITDPSTNFGDQLSSTDLAARCNMFGKKCLGFDTLGSLFLARDRDIATLKGLSKQYNGGLYIATTRDHAFEICEKLGGNFDKTKQQCTDFNRGDIDTYPFP